MQLVNHLVTWSQDIATCPFEPALHRRCAFESVAAERLCYRLQNSGRIRVSRSRLVRNRVRNHLRLHPLFPWSNVRSLLCLQLWRSLLTWTYLHVSHLVSCSEVEVLSILQLMNQRSLIPRGQEHWHGLRTGTYGQRLIPLNTRTIVLQLLPQESNHLEESLKRGGNAGRDEFCPPGTVISYLAGREMRRTVDLWAKQKQTVWSACQTHNRVPLWELGGRRDSVLGCSVAQKGGHVVPNSCWNGFDLVQSSTKDRLLRELELDRPSAIRISVPEAPGARPSNCSAPVDHRWREKRRRHWSIQKSA